MPGLRSKYGVSLSATQVAELTHVNVSYTARFAQVQRARIILLAHHNPEWSLNRIAAEVVCCVATVKKWWCRWSEQSKLEAQVRHGARRKFSALHRAQIIAVACCDPRLHGKVFKRWSAEKLRAVAIERGIVSGISASTIRRWLRTDQIKPWRSHSWQKLTDPQFVEKGAGFV